MQTNTYAIFKPCHPHPDPSYAYELRTPSYYLLGHIVYYTFEKAKCLPPTGHPKQCRSTTSQSPTPTFSLILIMFCHQTDPNPPFTQITVGTKGVSQVYHLSFDDNKVLKIINWILLKVYSSVQDH